MLQVLLAKSKPLFAAKNGGVFGIGGEPMSQAETAALKEISLALDISIPSLSGV